MFSWLVDHAGLVYLFLGILGLVLGSLWWMSRSRHYLFGLIGAAGLLVLVWLLTLFLVTDRVQIVRNVEAMAQAIDKRNLDQFFKHLSGSFDHEGMNAQQFREYVEPQLKLHKVTVFHVSKIVAENVSRQTGKGQVAFWIDVQGNWQGEVPPLRCEASFVLERDEWRLKGFKLFLGNTPTEFKLPAGR